MVIAFFISFTACIVGAICGMGGGVIIKPVLDFIQFGSASQISFMSGCTVLAMTTYSVGKSLLSKEKTVEMKTVTPLAIGAAVGGVAGKRLFNFVRRLFANGGLVGAVQSVSLAIITTATLIYTIKKEKIITHSVTAPPACGLIGLVLGVVSSFLGIGGGPINLVVLYYFFSMPTKTAAANSLYIILFSQLASVVSTVISGVPEYDLTALLLMMAGGVCGGIVGRKLTKKMDNRAVDKLFILLMVFIILISCYNAWTYAMG
ncbi:MAG: sulfite exporter TauE/SafE family protein [Oscillospiraceae bacterium]|nr:sulfite exporter TauE/SafE family protein [Oscillospiraceae bacterium]